jgi:hypothetical protein
VVRLRIVGAVDRLVRLVVVAALVAVAAVLRDRRITESERALGLLDDERT